MNTYIYISRSLAIKSNTFACLLTNNHLYLKSIAIQLNTAFNCSPVLVDKYNSLENLWRHTLIAQSNKYFVIITKNHDMVIFNLYNLSTYCLKLPPLEEICVMNVLNKIVVIGTVSQLVIMDLENLKFTTIDYFDNRFLFNVDTTWQFNPKALKICYSGDLHSKFVLDKLFIKGVIGILYNKDEYKHHYINYKDNKEEEDKDCYSKDYYDTDSSDYIIHIVQFTYAPITFTHKLLTVKTIINNFKDKSLLIVRNSSDGRFIVIGVNSHNKYYCQVFVFKEGNMQAVQLRPLYFLSTNDTLPCNSQGKTSMLISDIQWSENGLFVIILFTDNYFCVVAQNGKPLNLLYNKSILCFHTLLNNKNSYTNIKITKNKIWFFNKQNLEVVEYKTQLSIDNMWTLSSSKVNELIKQMVISSELVIREDLVKELRRALNNEMNYSLLLEESNAEEYDQAGSGVSTTKLDAETLQFIKKMISFIENIRWNNNTNTVIQRILEEEMHKMFHTLCANNESLYCLQLIEFFKDLTFGNKDNSIDIYGYESERWREEEQRLNFERRKVLLIMHMLIQFRSARVTRPNVIYLVAALVMKDRYRKQKNIFREEKHMINLLMYTIYLWRERVRLDYDPYIEIFDMGLLQELVFECCESSLPEEFQFLCKREIKEGSSMNEEKSIAMTVTVMESLMNLYKPEKLEIIFELLKLTIQKHPKAKHKLKAITENKYEHLSYIYSCIDLLEKGNYNHILMNVKKLMETAITPEVLLRNECPFEGSLIVIIVYSCLLLTSLTILQGNNKFTVSVWEGHTFLYKSLSEEDHIATFNQLKKEIKNTKQVPPILCKSNTETLIATALLIQLSEYKTAIQSLTQSNDPDSILLGLLILNNQVNESPRYEKNLLGGKYISLLIHTITEYLNNYSLKLSLREREYNHIFSTCILLSSKVTGVIILHLALPWFILRLQNLMHRSTIIEHHLIKIKPCNSLLDLFGDIEVIQQVFNKLFINTTQAMMFNNYIEESVRIIGAAIQVKLLKFIEGESLSDEFIRTSKVIPLKVANEIKEIVEALLALLWRVKLLFDMERKSSALRVASTLLRFSSIVGSEQEELEFIQQSLYHLKEIDYKEVNVVEEKEVLRELANALEIYTEKWKMLLKTDLTNLFSLIKSTNINAYNTLINYMPQRKQIINGLIKSRQKRVKSDILYKEMIEKLKKVLINMKEKNSSLSECAEQAMKLKENLRSILNDINTITGIPKSTVIGKKDNRLLLKSATMFDKINDNCSGSFKSSILLEEAFRDLNRSIHITEEVGKWDSTILGNAIGIWKLNSNNTLKPTNNPKIINSKSLNHSRKSPLS